jgi:hypothetical protein
MQSRKGRKSRCRSAVLLYRNGLQFAHAARLALALGILVALGCPTARAELRTDLLSKHKKKAWKELEALAFKTDSEGRPLHPTLHRLWIEVDSSPHVVHVELLRLRGSSPIAGRFRIERIEPDGRIEARLTLNLRTIDRVVMGGHGTQHVPFGALGRAARRAQVLCHELAHAAWAASRPERARLGLEAQGTADRLATLARTAGTGTFEYDAELEANERSQRLLEEPALLAELAVSAELQASFGLAPSELIVKRP